MPRPTDPPKTGTDPLAEDKLTRALKKLTEEQFMDCAARAKRDIEWAEFFNRTAHLREPLLRARLARQRRERDKP